MMLWFADRGTALVAYFGLWLAAVTGVFYNARAFGLLHRLSRASHVPVTVGAAVSLAAHVVIGTIDAFLVFAGEVPHPAFGDIYFATGLFVGLVALVVIVTATLAFLDPKRFERPWDPRSVHAFAYAGYAFATMHAIGIGTDAALVAVPVMLAASGILLVAIGARFVAGWRERAAAG